MSKVMARLTLGALFFALPSGTAPAEPAGQRSIDAAKSRARFSVSHLWVERVIGTVPILSGSVTLVADSIIPTSVAAVLDATRIETDEPDRDKSLRSPDFFDAQKFPTWAFVSTKITPNGPNAFEMDGNLTIHGVAQLERLQVSALGDVAHPVYDASAEVNRHAFGMTVTRLDSTIGATAHVALEIALK
jgi:polyisoprenoid-binding protein YceI